MGTVRCSVLGLVWMALFAFGCGKGERGGDDACKDCSSAGGGASNSAGGASGRGGSAPAAGSTAMSTGGASGGDGGSSATATGGSGAHAGSLGHGGNGAGTGGGGVAGDGDVGASAGQGGDGAGSAAVAERVATVTWVLNLVVKDGYVYFSDAEDNEQEFTSGHVRRVSVTGGTPRTYAQAPSVPEGTASSLDVWGIATDGSYIYWGEDPVVSASHVAKTSIETGETVDVWSDESCDFRKPLTLDGTELYWLASCVGVSGQLMTASTTGGAASVVAGGNDPAFKPNPYGSGAEIRGLAVGNGYAVWTHVTGDVISLPLAGPGTPVTIKTITQVDGPAAIFMAGTRAVYLQPDYMQQARGDIYSFVPDPDYVTAATSIVHVAQEQLADEETALAVDGDLVYWGVTDAIKRAPITGGDEVVVVPTLPNPGPRALAVDETHVYWADDTGIWRARK